MNSDKVMNVFFIVAATIAVLYVLDKYFSAEVKSEPVQEGFEDAIKESPKKESKEVEAKEEQVLASLNAQDKVKPEDLLPVDEEATAWARTNPKGRGSLEFKNFLEAGYHIGVDTQLTSHKNANLQIRSEPANPQVACSIWGNSSIMPDKYRRELEVGESH